MASFFSRWFSKDIQVAPLKPGIYHYLASDDTPIPFRLHLRIEDDESGILIINAATVLHLNPTAAAYALELVNGSTPEEAARAISQRYNVSRRRAREDYDVLQQKIITIATNPDVDPVLFMNLDRAEPYESTPAAPYRLDVALTYTTNPDGALDPLARARVDRELTTEEWKQVLTKAWEAGIPHVAFTGGEPTRRSDLVELVAYAEELGQVTGILTDGRRLSDASYVEALSQAGLDHFLIALVPESEKSLSGLKNALASDVFTAVHLTLTSSLIAEVDSWLDRFHDFGVQAISISAAESTEMMKAALEETRELAATMEMDLIWDLPAPYSKINPIALEVLEASSGAGRAWIYVEPDGDVLPEQGVDKILGNLLDDPWERIWERAKGEDAE
jgi:organic radical activating enzyme